MKTTFLFVLDNDFLLTATEEALAIGEGTILQMPEGQDIPEKFFLCVTCATKMLAGEPVTQIELQGLLDAVGGYYMAMMVYAEKHATNDGLSDDEIHDRIVHADELLRYATRLQEITKPLWSGLTLIQGGKQ